MHEWKCQFPLVSTAQKITLMDLANGEALGLSGFCSLALNFVVGPGPKNSGSEECKKTCMLLDHKDVSGLPSACPGMYMYLSSRAPLPHLQLYFWGLGIFSSSASIHFFFQGDSPYFDSNGTVKQRDFCCTESQPTSSLS